MFNCYNLKLYYDVKNEKKIDFSKFCSIIFGTQVTLFNIALKFQVRKVCAEETKEKPKTKLNPVL